MSAVKVKVRADNTYVDITDIEDESYVTLHRRELLYLIDELEEAYAEMTEGDK